MRKAMATHKTQTPMNFQILPIGWFSSKVEAINHPVGDSGHFKIFFLLANPVLLSQ